MAGEVGLSRELETSSMSAERNEDWICQSLAITVTEDFCQKRPLSVLAGKRVVMGIALCGAVHDNRNSCSRKVVLWDGGLKPTLCQASLLGRIGGSNHGETQRKNTVNASA